MRQCRPTVFATLSISFRSLLGSTDAMSSTASAPFLLGIVRLSEPQASMQCILHAQQLHDAETGDMFTTGYGDRSVTHARALYSWYASTMNSLHSSGQPTPDSRISRRKLKEPWK